MMELTGVTKQYVNWMRIQGICINIDKIDVIYKFEKRTGHYDQATGKGHYQFKVLINSRVVSFYGIKEKLYNDYKNLLIEKGLGEFVE